MPTDNVRVVTSKAKLHFLFPSLPPYPWPAQERQTIVRDIQQTIWYDAKTFCTVTIVIADKVVKHHSISPLVSVMIRLHVQLNLNSIYSRFFPLHRAHVPRSIRTHLTLTVNRHAIIHNRTMINRSETLSTDPDITAILDIGIRHISTRYQNDIKIRSIQIKGHWEAFYTVAPGTFWLVHLSNRHPLRNSDTCCGLRHTCLQLSTSNPENEEIVNVNKEECQK